MHLLPVNEEGACEIQKCELCGFQTAPMTSCTLQKCSNCSDLLGWACDNCINSGNWERFVAGMENACRFAPDYDEEETV